jgi:hypothetical protein
MAKIDLTQFTPPAGEIEKLGNLIFLNTIRDGQINEIFTFLLGQKNGGSVGLITGMGQIGRTSQGCGGEYDEHGIGGIEQKWDINEWEIKEALCYDKLVGTIAEYALRKGINIGDLTTTEYMSLVVEPVLKEAIENLILRLALFGNKTITSNELKGDITVENMNTIDGIWKRVFDGVADGSISRTEIEANKKTTIALQKQAIRADGVATKIIDDMIADTPVKLQQKEQKLILSKALWDAWKADVRRSNKGSEGQWDSLFAGVRKGEIDGITTYVIPFMDEIVTGYLKNTTNDGAYDNPYRAILTTKENNLLLGTTNTKENFDELDTWFDKKDDKTYIKAKDTLGAMILSNDLIHVAF